MVLHELSIAGGVCRAAAEHAGGARIAFLRIEVGTLSGVLADALDFCIREVAKTEELGEPEIVIEEKAPVLKCACGAEYEVADILDACPRCGGFDREVISGMDVYIREIRTEAEENG